MCQSKLTEGLSQDKKNQKAERQYFFEKKHTPHKRHTSVENITKRKSIHTNEEFGMRKDNKYQQYKKLCL